MMSVLKPVIFLCCLSCASGSCASGSIERVETPAPNVYVNTGRAGMAFIRNVYTEFSIRHLPEKEIRQIMSDKSFAASSPYRLPRLLFFMLTIKNTGELPLFFTGGNIVYEKTRHAAVKPNEFRQNFTSQMYASFDFAKLTSARRIIAFGYGFDFLSNTINYKLDFILPDEIIVQIIAFELPPPTVINYRLEFTLKARNVPRTIGFDMTRFEYRTEGDDFIRKGDISEDFL